MAEEEEEDLTKVAWGAGLTKLLDTKIPQFVFFCLGWACLGLPCYLITGSGSSKAAALLSSDADTIFPITLSVLLLALCVILLRRLRSNARLASPTRASAPASLNGAAIVRRSGGNFMSEPMLDHIDDMSTTVSASGEPGAAGGGRSWRALLGLQVRHGGLLGAVEVAAFAVAILGYISLGWVIGLTTFCAYDKASPPTGPPTDNQTVTPTFVPWEECFQISRADPHVAQDEPTHLPPGYFVAVLTATYTSVACPLAWFLLWKGARQALRPARAAKAVGEGLRELPQTAMFALAVSIGLIAGLGAWVFRQMIGLIHNLFFYQIDQLGAWNCTGTPFLQCTQTPFFYDANVHTPPPSHGLPPALVILSPVVGGLIVAFLVKTWAPEAKGHGVPEVMDAIHYKRGKIRPSVAGVKILASSFSIGEGGGIRMRSPACMPMCYL